jgi:DNA-binding response OmpR family regulator
MAEEFGSALRDMLRFDALGVLFVAALTLSALLMIPYVGNVIGFAALVVGARLYQSLIRGNAPSARALVSGEREQAGEIDGPGPRVSWALAVLAATALVAPFVLRQSVESLPIPLRWGLILAGFASWLIVPLVVLAFFARDRRGPVPPRVLLGALGRHPLAALAAVLVLPVGFVLLECGVVLIARGEDRLPSLVQDLYPRPAYVFEKTARDNLFRYKFDDAAYSIRYGTLPEAAYPIYLTGLSRGYTLVGSIPPSLSRHFEYMFDKRVRYVSDPLHLGTLTTLILAAAALILSLQARWLGLIASLGSCRPVTAGTSPPATRPAFVDPAPVGAQPSWDALVTASEPSPATATAPAPMLRLDFHPGRLFSSPAGPSPRPHPTSDRRLQTLLVVDAQRGFAAGLGRVLSSRGFDVLVASTASEASDLVRDSWPDLVVLDMQLPDHSAFELCRELSQGGPAPGGPIVIATSQSANADAIAAMACVANDYLIKPFAIDALVDRIEHHLARGHVGSPSEVPTSPVWEDGPTPGDSGAGVVGEPGGRLQLTSTISQIFSYKRAATQDPCRCSEIAPRHPRLCPELALVADAWPTVPEPIRAAILALVEATVPARAD